jgi:hypothetical protein
VRAGSLALPLSGITDARPNLPPQQPAQYRFQICGEIRLACVRGRSIRAHHKKATARKQVEIPAHHAAKPPFDAIPGHGRAYRPADRKSHSRGLLLEPGVVTNQQVAHQTGAPRTGSRAHGQRKLSAAAHPGLRGKDQALNWSRPLRRRAARTARPARVRIRSRKPWVFARRRLFGWNVRLLTGTPGKRS